VLDVVAVAKAVYGTTGNRQPPSLATNARRIGGGMVLERRPMLRGSP
jgi:hypothetical protein